MIVSFGSVLIARINRNPRYVEKVLSKIFKTSVKYDNSHEFIFNIQYPVNDEEFSKELKAKFSKPIFNVRLCWHGYILITFDLKDELSKDEKESLPSKIHDLIEFPIQHAEDLFEYDVTITPKNENAIFPSKTFNEISYSNNSCSQLIFSSVKKFKTTVNQTLLRIFNDHNSTISSIIKKNYAHTILLLFMITRSQYLRQFYASKRCTIVDNRQVYDQIINEFGNVITSNQIIFDILIDPYQKFISEESGKYQVSVISMDIVGFSKSLSENGSSSMEEQIIQFNTLTKWIYEWLGNKNKSVPLPKPGQTMSTSKFWVKCVGDGYIIAFKDLEDAFNLSKILQSKENQKILPLRIGLQHGTVESVKDSLGREDLIGSAITLAVRIMSQAGKGNIYAEKPFIKKLNDDNGNDFVKGKDLGTHLVKHGIPLDFFNIFEDNFGNPIQSKFDDEK
ncbi:MAG: hypothetical protein ACE5RC_03820 [Nitrosopumilus sp.]